MADGKDSDIEYDEDELSLHFEGEIEEAMNLTSGEFDGAGKSYPTIIISSGDERDDSDNNLAVSKDEDEESGRLTPQLQAAIRRSMMNISHKSEASEDGKKQNEISEDEEELPECSMSIKDSKRESAYDSHSNNGSRIINNTDDSEQELAEHQNIPIILGDDEDDSGFVRESFKKNEKPRKSLKNLKKPMIKFTHYNVDDISEVPSENERDGPRKNAPDHLLHTESLNISGSPIAQSTMNEIEDIPPERETEEAIALDISEVSSDLGVMSLIDPPQVNQKMTQDRALLKPQQQKNDIKESLCKKLIEPHSSSKPLSPIRSPFKLPGAPELPTQVGHFTPKKLEIFHRVLASRPTDDAQADEPIGVTFKLLPHQKHALAWMLWREQQQPPGGFLGDDMGLGKSLTLISLILKSIELEESSVESQDKRSSMVKGSKILGGTLIVCPPTLLCHWEREVLHHCANALLIAIHHGKKRNSLPRTLVKYDIVLTTYSIVRQEHEANGPLFKINWRRIVLDEGHLIRNPKSQLYGSVCNLSGQSHWILSGTPIHNKEQDLFSILKFLKCPLLDNIGTLREWAQMKNTAGVNKLTNIIKTLILRRTKDELVASGDMATLPKENIDIVWVELSPEERLVYDRLLSDFKRIFEQFLEQAAVKKQILKRGNKIKSSQILVLLLRLRQMCCHASLLKCILDREDIETNIVEDLDIGGEDADLNERAIENILSLDNPVFNRKHISSKFQAVFDIINRVHQSNDKMIIVSQWTGALDLIAENLIEREWHFSQITGRVPVSNRGGIIERFNQEAMPRILLLSLTAGGVGLNLVSANHLLLIDAHWNPQQERQAQSRINRMGQQKNVFIYKLLCKNTIEESIKSMQERKLELTHNLMSDSAQATTTALPLSDLKLLFEI